MLEHILKWMGATDDAILAMGPVLSIAIAWLGGYGLTQTVKFIMERVIPDDWYDWAVRVFAIMVTFGFAWELSDMPPILCAAVAVVQPRIYSLSMAVVRKRWPWLEAGFIAGSANPAPDAIQARVDAGKKLRYQLMSVSESGTYRVVKDNLDTQKVKSLRGSDGAN